MRSPLLLTSNEVQQQAVDAGLPPYAVAVVSGMLQPAGTLHTRYSATAETLYNSLEVDGAINLLKSSKFTELIPVLLCPGLGRGVATQDDREEVHWVSRSPESDRTAEEVYARLDHWGLDIHWVDQHRKACYTDEPELVQFMEDVDGIDQ